MNPLNPKELLLTKWTAVKPIAKQKHFLVSRVIQPELILPLFSVLLKPPIMRTSCLAAGPLSSVAQTSSG